MLRSGLLGTLILALIAGCGDLTRIPKPPVHLSALDAPRAAVEDGSSTLVTANRGPHLAHAVAAGSLLTVHLPDIGGTIRRFRKTSLYQLFHSPAFASLMAPLANSFSGLRGSGLGGVDTARLLDALKGEFVLSIEDITLDDKGRPDSIRLIAGVTVSGALQSAEQMLQMISMMAASRPGTKVEKGQVAGTPFSRVVITKPQALILEFAIHKGAFLFGLGRETVTAAIQRMEAQGADSITRTPPFRKALELCGDSRDAFRIHVNVAGALARFGSLIPGDAKHFIAVLGLDKFRAFTTVARLEGKDIVLSTFLDSPGGKDMLTSLLSAQPVDRQFLSRIPADASSFSLFAVDGRRILRHLRETLRADLVEEMEKGLGTLRQSGLDLERDIFETFGPRFALVTLRNSDDGAQGMDAIWNHILGAALVIDVRDPDGAKRVLERLPVSNHTHRRRKYEIDGVPAVTYSFSMNQLPDGFAPSYAQVDDFLVVALSEESLRRMLKRPSEETLKRYRKMFHDVPQTVATLSYDDTRRGLGLITNAFLAGMQAGLRRTGRNVALPPGSLADLMQDFNPTLSYTVADERGIFSRTRSPTAGLGGTGGLSGLLVMASVAIPTFTVNRRRANETSALTMLRNLQAAQESFKLGATRDDDGDGEGEYGFLAELTGGKRLGDRRVRRTTPLVSGLVRTPGGHYEFHGYRFRVYLPAEDGSPVGGHEKRSRIRQVDGDLAETVMVIVAWPIRRPATGKRAFLLDASGTVYACADGPYSAEKAPPPDALNSQRGNLASEPLPAGAAAQDGLRWIKARG